MSERGVVSILRPDERDTPVYVRITSTISSITPEMMDVANLETGKAQRMFVNAVLARELRNAYPNEGYVGKCFEIKKFAPKVGKAYHTFEVFEVEVTGQAKEPTSVEGDAKSDFGDQSYREYLKSKLWKEIRRRVLKRDGNLCYRCGGRAVAVHHRSYSEQVKNGNDDGELASICRGCHRVIHFDDAGNRRSLEESNRLLEIRHESAMIPTPKVDLRRRLALHPPEWDRMSAVQQKAWQDEYQRKRLIRMLAQRNDPKITNLNRRFLYPLGMDDQAIDEALAQHSRKRRAKKKA